MITPESIDASLTKEEIDAISVLCQPDNAIVVISRVAFRQEGLVITSSTITANALSTLGLSPADVVKWSVKQKTSLRRLIWWKMRSSLWHFVKTWITNKERICEGQ